jgi:hypothetical protein
MITIYNLQNLQNKTMFYYNGTTRFKKCKHLFEYQHLVLRRDIWGQSYKTYNAVSYGLL